MFEPMVETITFTMGPELGHMNKMELDHPICARTLSENFPVPIKPSHSSSTAANKASSGLGFSLFLLTFNS